MIQKYLFFMFVIVISLNASIVTTKHNLSSNGSGDIKASTEKEVCVFCHIPHGAQPGVALWNRAMPSGSYTMYSSTYLERTKYNTVAPTLGTAIDTPGNLSRQCLSCHDGTIAIGDVYLVRGTMLEIAMTGTEGGFMPNSAAGFIGTNLSTHHPVGYKYDSTMTFPVTLDQTVPGGGTARDNELLPATAGAGIPSVDKTKVKLYTYSDGEYVECSSCHDPHTNNTKFLREDTSATKHGLNVKTTCISCHEKAGWTDSAHDTATTVTHSTTQSTYGTLIKVGEMGCINCHTPHKGEGQPYLLRKIEQNTCFQGASGTTSTACHGTGGAKDIETPLNPTNFGHGDTLINQDGVHTNLDYIYGEGGAANFPTGSGGIDWYNSVHVECMDCHNQHAAKPGTRVLATSMYPTTPSLTANKIIQSGPLTGASGVRPTWPTTNPLWAQIDVFTPRETAEFEYEICFKCHSSWGLGNVGTPISDYDTRSDATIKFTDVAWEFNIENRSGHPVIVEADASRLGSYIPQALSDAEMKTPWKSEGAQTMYCSDCHGTTSEDDGTTSKGPHGSSRKFMLKGTNYLWPTDAGGTHFQAGETSGNGGKRNWTGVFCDNCHNIGVSVGTQNAPHNTRKEMDGLYCVRCHVAIPHGSPLSRLQAYITFPEPYNYGGNMAKLTGFRKKSSYAKEDASGGSWSPTETTGNGNCNDKHPGSVSGADSSPY